TFQWYKDNVLISGATNATYTLANPIRGDDGSLFKVVVANTASNVNYSVTSSNALLTVIPDNTPPTVTSVVGTTNQVTVTFSEKVSLATATNLNNYSLNGGLIVNSASLSGGTVVQLGTSFLTPGQSYLSTV